jgi:hypothetical protein
VADGTGQVEGWTDEMHVGRLACMRMVWWPASFSLKEGSMIDRARIWLAFV